MPRKARSQSPATKPSDAVSDVVFCYTAQEIEGATNGRVNPGLLRTWIMDGRLKTPLQPTSQGKRRFYSLENAHEVALIATFADRGLTLDTATKWTHQIYDELEAGDWSGARAWSDPAKGMISVDMSTPLIDVNLELGPDFCVLNLYMVVRGVDMTLPHNRKPGSKHDDE